MPGGKFPRFKFSPDFAYLIMAGPEGEIRIIGLDDTEFAVCLFDREAVKYTLKYRQAEFTDKNGTKVTSAFLKDSALPAGAICTCDTVGGDNYTRKTAAERAAEKSSGSSGGTSGGGSLCTCNQICTCVPVK